VREIAVLIAGYFYRNRYSFSRVWRGSRPSILRYTMAVLQWAHSSDERHHCPSSRALESINEGLR